MSADWMADAACVEHNPEAFYPEPRASGADAKAICAACPVSAACLDFALATGETWGIWGGTTPNQRHTMLGRGPTAHHLAKTRCTHGHALTEENTYVRPDGSRNCRACRREAIRAVRAEKKGAAA